ncbi:MAG TPA: fumarate hydratase C-terminal domain-containing protein [Anaeromyxobacteraceae bacterium]|jgi:fumarate hydratase class I|nr:fumarate hydratase C-terminal domain-containing protein [Anaeromyxobacteraceae bacterium]
MAKIVALPLDGEQARELRVRDEVLVRGRLITGRAAARRRLLERDHPEVRAWAAGTLLFHGAPIVIRDAAGRWRVRAAAPAASLREEPYAAELMARYGLRGFVGKGGLGVRTLAALARHGGVYLHAVPGPAVVLARSVRRVEGVLLDELGMADAIWCLEVEDFPAVVTMDAHGQSLHALRAELPRHATDGSARAS